MAISGKKILVTGGVGYVGSHLVEQLASENEVTILDNLMRGPESQRNLQELSNKLSSQLNFCFGDINQFENVSHYVKNSDIVFHLAGLPSHRRALEDPKSYGFIDSFAVINILEAARLSPKPPKIIFTSTNKVYGDQAPPFSEEMPPQPKGPYALAKYEAERWCHLYHQYYGLNTVVARLFHVLGARAQPDREISIFTEQILNHQPINIHGIFNPDGTFTACSAGYTNIHDTVSGLIILAEKAHGFSIYNIGNDQETSVEELALEVGRHLGITPQIVHRQMLPHESLRHSANNTKLKSLGWQPQFSTLNSIHDYVDWRLNTGKRESFYAFSKTSPEARFSDLFASSPAIGYKPDVLLQYLQENPKVQQLFEAEGYLLRRQSQILFPKYPRENVVHNVSTLPEISPYKILFHSLSVGLTFKLLSNLVGQDHPQATESMLLHDLKKVKEISWRQLFPSDLAYQKASEYQHQILLDVHYPDEYARLHTNIGHPAAKKFLNSTSDWQLLDYLAYLSDELLEETEIQSNPLNKSGRLNSDPRYSSVNHDDKFLLQRQATIKIHQHIAEILHLQGITIGQKLISLAREQGLYY